VKAAGAMNPSEDSYVSSGNANTNNNGEWSLECGKHPDVGTEYVYLKFNVSSLSAGTSAFILSLYCTIYYVEARTFTIQLYSVTDDSWDETVITWNNRPANVSLLDTQNNVLANQWINFSSTQLDSFINVQISGDGTVSLMLGYTMPAGETTSRYNTFCTKEYATPSQRPILSYSGAQEQNIKRIDNSVDKIAQRNETIIDRLTQMEQQGENITAILETLGIEDFDGDGDIDTDDLQLYIEDLTENATQTEDIKEAAKNLKEVKEITKQIDKELKNLQKDNGSQGNSNSNGNGKGHNKNP
jgi:hypothetical protein